MPPCARPAYDHRRGENKPVSTAADSPWEGAEVPREREIEVEHDDLDPRILRAARLAAEAAINRAPLPVHNYGRSGNGEKALLKIIVGALAAMLAAAGVGFWSLYGVVSHVSQQVMDYHQQDAQNSERNHQDIQQIDQILERRYGQ